MRLTIERFRSAHRECYRQALAEIRAGKKQSHWIWFVFPQIRGLGESTTAQYYAIQNPDEAREYWHDPELASNMREILEALLEQQGQIWEILGHTDSMKLRSSMTLFLMVTEDGIFRRVLDRFYGGQTDRRTEEILETEGYIRN